MPQRLKANSGGEPILQCVVENIVTVSVVVIAAAVVMVRGSCYFGCCCFCCYCCYLLFLLLLLLPSRWGRGM